MTHELLTRPWTTRALLEVYADRTMLDHALLFERELAQAQASAGLITESVAASISKVCLETTLDPAGLADSAAFAGTLAIPLVAHLRSTLKDDEAAAAAVHQGATSQDLADTMMVLQAKQAATIVDSDLQRFVRAAAGLAREHASTAALGRTLLQDARPITLGLRFANWLAEVEESRRTLAAASAEAATLQFGGAVGTLAELEGKGAMVAEKLAAALGLGSVAPWHSRRDRVANLVSCLGIIAGALGKVARDIGLLAQSGLGELHEPKHTGRGSSSAMEGKRNPTGCQLAISAAIRAPGLVSTILAAMPQELERGLGGWQLEAPVVGQLFMIVGGSADAMATVMEGLEIDLGAVEHNLEGARVGRDVGEAAKIVENILSQFDSDI